MPAALDGTGLCYVVGLAVLKLDPRMTQRDGDFTAEALKWRDLEGESRQRAHSRFLDASAFAGPTHVVPAGDLSLLRWSFFQSQRRLYA